MAGRQEYSGCTMESDTLTLAKEAVRTGLINQDVLDNLTFLHPQVPSSMKHRYLLMKLRDTINNDDQILTEVLRGFIQSRLHSLDGTASGLVAEINCEFCFDHIPDLAELLVRYASKWRFIGTALKFQPSDLDNIQACHYLQLGSPQSFLIQLLGDWVEKKHKHTLPPTVNSLKSALNSNLVGLGSVACEVEKCISPQQICTTLGPHALPCYAARLHLREIHDEIQATPRYPNIVDLQAEENGSVLLEIQITSEEKQAWKQINYQWLMNRMAISESMIHTGTTTPILCISKANLDMDGSKYACKITIHSSKTAISKCIVLKNVTLRVSCPPLDSHKSDLASMYSAQPKVPEDTWPPIASKKFTNLALIKQKWVNYGAEYAYLTIRGDMDDILQHKERIEYKQIFRSLKSGHVLFIEGRPGSGKTTLVHKISQDWAALPYGAIRLLLLVSLRVLNNIEKPNLDLSDFLSLFKDLRVEEKLLQTRNGKGVCFIFDGLDEFSPCDGKGSIVYKIINKEYLSQSTVIVASRPAAIAEFRNRADEVVEVLGFQSEQILDYFDCYSFSAISKSKKLKAYLLSHPNIFYMCYLPIHAAMVAFIFEVTGEIPKTETEIYSHFTCLTLKRNFTKNRTVTSATMHDLIGEEGTLFNQICELALEKAIANKQVICQDEIKSGYRSSDNTLGLITVDRTAGLYGFKDIYTFLHLTFQEYLAAYHITTLSDDKQLRLIEEYADEYHMLVVWKFFCGLTKFDANNAVMFKRIAQKFRGNVLSSIQCAYESQQTVTCNLLLELFEAKFKFESQYLTIRDFTALGYVLANALSPFSLSFENCNISIEAVNAMLSESDEKCLFIHSIRHKSEKIDSEQSECLNKILTFSKPLKEIEVHSTTSSALTCTGVNIFKSCTSLTKLHMHNVLIGSENLHSVLQNCKQELQELILPGSIGCDDFPVLAANLGNCKMLKVLDISFNNLAKYAELLASGLALCQSLQTLIITGNRINSEICTLLLKSLKMCKLRVSSYNIVSGNEIGISSLLEGLGCCDNLQELHLVGGNQQNEETLVNLFYQNWQYLHTLKLKRWPGTKVIAHASSTRLKSLVVLHISYIGTSENEVIALANGLRQCTNLTEFVIHNCKIRDKGAQALAEALCYCKEIHTLGFYDNEIGNVGAESILTSTSNMTNLKTLNLSNNLIGHGGEVSGLTSLKKCTALTSFNLNDNHIGRDGALAIAICLQYWPNLRELGLSGIYGRSNINRNGAMTLLENLSHSSQLRALNLSYNDIGDEVSISLMKSLSTCTQLTRVCLWGNGISKNGAREIQCITKHWGHIMRLIVDVD